MSSSVDNLIPFVRSLSSSSSSSAGTGTGEDKENEIVETFQAHPHLLVGYSLYLFHFIIFIYSLFYLGNFFYSLYFLMSSPRVSVFYSTPPRLFLFCFPSFLICLSVLPSSHSPCSVLPNFPLVFLFCLTSFVYLPRGLEGGNDGRRGGVKKSTPHLLKHTTGCLSPRGPQCPNPENKSSYPNHWSICHYHFLHVLV